MLPLLQEPGVVVWHVVLSTEVLATNPVLQLTEQTVPITLFGSVQESVPEPDASDGRSGHQFSDLVVQSLSVQPALQVAQAPVLVLHERQVEGLLALQYSSQYCP